MILNGYDTTVGQRYRVKDKVENTIKLLQSTERLELIDPSGVYAVSHNTDNGLPPFIFPFSIQNFQRELVTIFDQRTYINKEGRNVNLPEYNVMLLAAKLQQDLQHNQRTLIKSVRPFTVKAFANAIGKSLERTVTLDLNQKITLRVILAYYYICLMEDPQVDFKYVAQNSIKAALGYNLDTIRDIIEDLGYVGSLVDLLRVIKEQPNLFPLSRLDMSGLVRSGGSVFFSTSGFRMLMEAALEMPTIFTALCWGAATQRVYQNTMLGTELNVKEDRRVENFIKTVGYYYNAV